MDERHDEHDILHLREGHYDSAERAARQERNRLEADGYINSYEKPERKMPSGAKKKKTSAGYKKPVNKTSPRRTHTEDHAAENKSGHGQRKTKPADKKKYEKREPGERIPRSVRSGHGNTDIGDTETRTRSEIMRKSASKRKKSKRRSELFLFASIIVIILAAVVSLVVAVLFRVDEIVCINEAQIYSDEEIIQKSGITTGKSLITLKTSAVEAQLETNLPYIAKAEVKKSISGNVNVTVTYAEAKMAVSTGMGYVYLSADGKVLETGVPEIRDGVALVKGIELSSYYGGSKAEATDEEKYSVLFTVVKAFENCGLENITVYDIENIQDIVVVVGNNVEIELGGISFIDEKLAVGAETISRYMSRETDEIIIVDLTIEKRAYVRKKGEKVPEPETPTEPDTGAQEPDSGTEGAIFNG